MPFTTEQFSDIFKQYNLAVFPLQILFNIMALFSVLFLLKKKKYSEQIAIYFCAFLWIWSGAVYHITFFSTINPIATIFGILFILQGLIFIFIVNSKKIETIEISILQRNVAVALVLYALIIYPVVGHFSGHSYPNNPTFGLPCPTTIFTFGIMLLIRRNYSKYLISIAFIWSVIGFFAAIKMGVYEDIGLLLAGIITFYILKKKETTYKIVSVKN